MPIPIINGTANVNEVALGFLHEIPFFFSGVLFFLGVIIVLAGYTFQERRTGEGSIKAWMAVASFIVATLAIILFLYQGLIDGVTLSIAIGLAVVMAILYLTS